MMRSTADVLDALKEKLGLTSDYALAKALGVSRFRVSNYRTGKCHMNDEMALQVAEILEIDPGLILMICALERAKGKDTEQKWRRVVQALQATAAGVALTAALPLADTVNCILCSIAPRTRPAA